MAFIMMKKKKFKFAVDLVLADLSDIPFVNAMLFAKVRLLDGGSFSDTSPRAEVRNHRAVWGKLFQFSCRVSSNPTTGVLEACYCRVSIRKELKGGKSYEKLGFVDINLSEFAGSGVDGTKRTYILEGYSSGHQRQDNSRLWVNISMTLQSADPFFKVPFSRTFSPQELGSSDCDTNANLSSLPLHGLQLDPDGSDHVSVASASSGLGDSLPRRTQTTTCPDGPTTATLSTDFPPGHYRNSSSASQVSVGYMSSDNKTHSRQSSTDSGHVARKGSEGVNGFLRQPKKLPPMITRADPNTGKLLGATRVDAEEMINDILKGHLSPTEESVSKQQEQCGLQLYISKDGASVTLGSQNARWSAHGCSYEPVIVEDTVPSAVK